jgi:hypothetical protein
VGGVLYAFMLTHDRPPFIRAAGETLRFISRIVSLCTLTIREDSFVNSDFWTLKDPLPAPIAAIQQKLGTLGIPWGIDGGWALDLAIGAQIRPHDDVDATVFREDQLRLRTGLPCEPWLKMIPGDTWEPWQEDETLTLPIHAIKQEGGVPEIEWFLMEKEGDYWFYRKNPAIRMRADNALLMTQVSVPVLNPAIALLIKSGKDRPKDYQDFQRAMGWMNSHDKSWLAQALAIMNNRHPWLKSL